MILFTLFLASALMIGCVNFFKISDLQTGDYKYPNHPEKAKLLMREMGVAHQIHKWDSLETYTVKFEDEFYGFLGKQVHSFKEQKMQFALDYIPKTFNGQLEVLNGEEKGKTWGIQSWETYYKDKNGNAVRKKDKDIKFWRPTYQYFIELPVRIQEATAIDFFGSKIIDGIPCDGVIASWNTVNPQKDIDQYIVWIDRESKMIVKVDYTIRDQYKFLTGGVYYKDYKSFDGIPLPSTIPSFSSMKKGLLHTMKIKSFNSNVVPASTLRPLDLEIQVH